MDEPTYTSIDQAILDIMANTDCQYKVATIVAELVFHDDWTYDAGSKPRSVRAIGPKYSDIVIEFDSNTKEYYGYSDYPKVDLVEEFRKAGFPHPEDNHA